MEGQSPDRDGGDEALESLFEGMVLMTPSEIGTLEAPQSPPQAQQSLPDDEPSISAVSQPLDENLFSDLNLCSINEDQIHETQNVLALDSSKEASNFRKGLSSSSSLARSVENSGSRQGSRRKKRSFKIGYGRSDYSFEDGLQNNDNFNNISSVEADQSSVSPEIALHHGLQMQPFSTEMQQMKDDSKYVLAESNLEMPKISNFNRNDTMDSVQSNVVQMPSVENAEGSIEILEPEVVAENRDDDGKAEETVNEATDRCTNDHHLKTSSPNSAQIEPPNGRENVNFDVTGQVQHLPCDAEQPSFAAGGVSIEEKLVSIKVQISDRLKQLQERAASISLSRKEAAQRRRQAAEEVSIASTKYKELEKELEDACEREDFDRAESVSESLVIVEKSKEAALIAFRSAEADCDSMASKMQEILESQVEEEEEGIRMLKRLKQEAADVAGTVIKDAEDTASKEMDKWILENEALELKKMEVDLELKVIEDADAEVRESFDESVREDMEEKKILSGKRETLMQELQHLLALVRAKEAEIVENDNQIQRVEKKLSGMVSKFEDGRAGMKAKSEELQSILGKLESSSEFLYTKKKEVDAMLALAEEKRGNLTQLAADAGEEATVLEEIVGLRKSMASSFLQSRENKVRLAEKEKKVSEEVQVLRQHVAAARASLQELSSAKTSLHQEITSSKEKVFFIDKRGPELEAEKKVAAAARNFKEAGRIASEAKALSLEKDTASSNMERAFTELQKLEEEIKVRVHSLNESETLISSKEREAAMARCERLRLVAAAAREERSAALELEDLEEAENLLAEAEAADSEADMLQEACNFEGEQFMKISKQRISVAVASTITGKQLPEKSSYVQT